MNIKKELEHIKRIYDFELTSEQVQALDIAIESLDNEWIDVKDRLPKPSCYGGVSGSPLRSDKVLVSLKCKTYLETNYEVHLGYYSYREDKWLEEEKNKEFGFEVIAWKPLPEPYERKE